MSDLTTNEERELRPLRTLQTIGILGAGRVGTTIARQALGAGYEVRIAASGKADDIDLLVEIMTPGAVAADAGNLADGADLVILAIPLGKYRSLPVATLDGKIVIDAMNYWYPNDGHIPEFTQSDRTSSEVIRAFLPNARIVKTLNHIGYHDLEADGRPEGASDRRALLVASDDADAGSLVSAFIERIGYDAVQVDSLRAGQYIQPGTAIFNGRFTRSEIEAELDQAGQAGLMPSGMLI